MLFNDIEVTKKYFHTSKKAIPLNLVNTNNIVISYRVKQNNDTYKYLIGYSHDDGVIRLLCVILPQMSGYIKYFENDRKNMSFKIKEESVYLKYAEIWNKIKSILNVKFHSRPIYEDKYIKTKVKTSIIELMHYSQEMKSLKKEFIMFVFRQSILIQY